MLQFVRLLCKYPQIELIVIAQTVTSELVLGLQERKPWVQNSLWYGDNTAGQPFLPLSICYET